MIDTSRAISRITRLLAVLVVAAAPVWAEEATTGTKTPADSAPAPATIESTAILARETVAPSAEVKHVLIGWADLAAAYGDRMPATAKARTKAEADKLATEILAKATAGEDFLALMKTYSEDWGSSATGISYPVTPTAGLVAPFKNLSLRLEVGESGLVLSNYGWHVIKRIK